MARKRTSYYDNYWPSYNSTQPIEVDGIKAKNQRGKFVQNWWANRWIEALRDLMDSGRLSRGRSYARQGQVLGIDLQPGIIKARVQGSRPTPYKITIMLKPLKDAQWDAIFDALVTQAIFAAQLLNGEMPAEIEEVFNAVRVPLFPTSSHDLETQCSCPDWANPCKHVAAVYYLLGEQFDADPFLLFKLRGRDKEAVSEALRRRRAGSATDALTAPRDEGFQSVESEEVRDLAASLDAYWGTNDALASVNVRIEEPAIEMSLLKRAGLPDFVVPSAFRAHMELIYRAVTVRAVSVAFED